MALAHAALDALGDANRRAIVEILGAGPQSVRQISDQVAISRPAVSRHLRLLKQAGLVVDRAEGTRRMYELDGGGVDAVRRYFHEVWSGAATRFRPAVGSTGPG